MTADELDTDAIRARAEAVTKGPWVLGDRWHIAGTGNGRLDDDRCHYCAKGGEPVWSGIRPCWMLSTDSGLSVTPSVPVLMVWSQR